MSVLPPGLQNTSANNITGTSMTPQGSNAAKLATQTPSNTGTPAEQNVPPMSRFGLGGLASLVRPEENDQATFAIGQNLALMGVDLSEDAQILKNLASPWQETSRSEVEPYFTLPT
ncbi:hypothetical protein JCM33374_g1793 [Metschnikowia sp. JCM 33374]|nr:hypothetical protein JCM33374_g1793 [Metschnikowia sp. JCM 33374]